MNSNSNSSPEDLPTNKNENVTENDDNDNDANEDENTPNNNDSGEIRQSGGRAQTQDVHQSPTIPVPTSIPYVLNADSPATSGMSHPEMVTNHIPPMNCDNSVNSNGIQFVPHPQIYQPYTYVHPHPHPYLHPHPHPHPYPQLHSNPHAHPHPKLHLPQHLHPSYTAHLHGHPYAHSYHMVQFHHPQHPRNSRHSQHQRNHLQYVPAKAYIQPLAVQMYHVPVAVFHHPYDFFKFYQLQPQQYNHIPHASETKGCGQAQFLSQGDAHTVTTGTDCSEFSPTSAPVGQRETISQTRDVEVSKPENDEPNRNDCGEARSGHGNNDKDAVSKTVPSDKATIKGRSRRVRNVSKNTNTKDTRSSNGGGRRSRLQLNDSVVDSSEKGCRIGNKKGAAKEIVVANNGNNRSGDGCARDDEDSDFAGNGEPRCDCEEEDAAFIIFRANGNNDVDEDTAQVNLQIGNENRVNV